MRINIDRYSKTINEHLEIAFDFRATIEITPEELQKFRELNRKLFESIVNLIGHTSAEMARQVQLT